MKKSMLFHGFLFAFCTVAHAGPTATPPQKPEVDKPVAATQPVVTTSPAKPGTTPAATPTPAAVTPTPVTVEQPMNCQYHIPASTTKIETDLVQKWAEKATQQSFDLSAQQLDKQLEALKACYTTQGWQSFYDALQKSGNIKAIQNQNLMVSSMVNGTIDINAAKDNQWKIRIPLQVVYQNENEKLTQVLDIDLLVGRKPTGDLGIMQIIASPHQASNTADGIKTISKPGTSPVKTQ